MSRENVETVLRLIDAWNRGDRESWLTDAHPEIEWSSAVLREVEGEETTSKGPVEMEGFWDEWRAVWNLTVEVVEARDLGDTVLVLAQMRTKGKVSGAQMERPIGYVFDLDGGLIRRARAYLSSDEALEAVGFSE